MTRKTHTAWFSAAAILTAWTAIFLALWHVPVPHTPFICIQLEALFNGALDDAFVDAVKNQTLFVVWAIGVSAIVTLRIRGATRASGRTVHARGNVAKIGMLSSTKREMSPVPTDVNLAANEE